MCTVTYLPQDRGFILTSNRDERVSRPASAHIAKADIRGVQVYFPQDLQAGGTWIASSEIGYTLCLLNGAYKPHVGQSSAKKSRGLVLLDFFQYQEEKEESTAAQQFAEKYDFLGIEPFTLLFAGFENNEQVLAELRWDGTSSFFTPLDHANHYIWSSVMLYTPEIIALRERSFRDWLLSHKEEPVQPREILHFHHFGGDEAGGMKIDLGDKKTVSVCSVSSKPDKTHIWYENLTIRNLDHLEFDTRKTWP